MKNLTLFGIDYEVSDERVIYNEYRAIFFQEACKAEKEMHDYCKSNTIVDKIGFMQLAEFGKQLINNGLAVVVRNLSEKEIYDYSVDSIRRMAVEPLVKFDEAVASVVAQIDAIDDELRRAEEARQRQINSASSSWRGGGHGLEGAIKGAADAAILNAASGALTKAMTAGDSKKAKSKHQTQLSNLLNGADTTRKLCRAIYDDVFYLVKTYVKILIDDKGEKIQEVSEAEIVKSNDIFNNLKSGVYTKPEIEQQMWVKVLTLFPYDIDYFIYLIKTHEDRLDEIKVLVEWYNLPMSRIADTLLTDKYSFDNITELEEVNEKKEQLLLDLGTFGIAESDLVSSADAKIDEILVQRRTYEEVVYDTEEACEKAKNLDAEYSESISAVDTSDFTALTDLYLTITEGENSDDFADICNKNAEKLHEPLVALIKASKSEEELVALKEKLSSEKNAELNAPLIKQIDSKVKSLNTMGKVTDAKDKAVDTAKGLFGKAKGIFKKN